MANAPLILEGFRFVSLNHKSQYSVFKVLLCKVNNAHSQTQIPPYTNLEKLIKWAPQLHKATVFFVHPVIFNCFKYVLRKISMICTSFFNNDWSNNPFKNFHV